MAKLPPELAAPTSEDGFSLVFAKGARQWFVHLWSNQVVTASIAKAPPLVFRKERSYKFVLPDGVKLEHAGFYATGVASATQRERAVAAYERAVRTKLGEGYALVSDSRVLERAAPHPKPARASAKRVGTLRGFAALEHWGNVARARTDARSVATLAAFEKHSEAEMRFAALVRAPREGAPVTVRGDVMTRAGARAFVWVPGDLHVRGNLALGVDLFVGGDLVVDGVVRDLAEWTHVLVRGNVTAGAIDMGSQLYARGTVSAPLVIVDGTGEIVAKRLETELLVEQGYDHTITGRIEATRRARFDEDADVALGVLESALRATFTRPARAALTKRGERFYFDKRPLVRALEKRARVFA